MAKKKILKITQVKSAIGYRAKAKRTIAALGLHRLHQTVEHEDTPAIRGMLKQMDYLVKVEEK